jgi:mannitol/fructose-specific phosphotransferase system IIA component (Ntr-type)
MKLLDFLVREAIITDLLATTKEGVFREIVCGLQNAGHLAEMDPESLTRALVEREEISSQAIGHGVACPEGGHPGVDRVIRTIALSRRGVEFDALDGKPVDIIVLLCGPPIKPGQPIRPRDFSFFCNAWKVVARDFTDDRFLGRLRQCRTREEVFDLIVEVDREIP